MVQSKSASFAMVQTPLVRPRAAHVGRARRSADRKFKYIPDFPLNRFPRTAFFPEDLERADSLICEHACEELIVTQAAINLVLWLSRTAVARVTRRNNYASCVVLLSPRGKIRTDTVASCGYGFLFRSWDPVLEIIVQLDVSSRKSSWIIYQRENE